MVGFISMFVCGGGGGGGGFLFVQCFFFRACFAGRVTFSNCMHYGVVCGCVVCLIEGVIILWQSNMAVQSNVAVQST